MCSQQLICISSPFFISPLATGHILWPVLAKRKALFTANSGQQLLLAARHKTTFGLMRTQKLKNQLELMWFFEGKSRYALVIIGLSYKYSPRCNYELSATRSTTARKTISIRGWGYLCHLMQRKHATFHSRQPILDWSGSLIISWL